MTSSASPALLRLGAWAAIASGVIAAIGMVYLAGMFASFATGATASGTSLGWTNDLLVLLSYLLVAPIAVVLYLLMRRAEPRWSGLVAAFGLVAVAAIVVFQGLLVTGVLTFDQEIGPASFAGIALGVWFVTAGFLGSRSGALPGGGRMGLLAAVYVGYPIWAIWIARRLRHLARVAA